MGKIVSLHQMGVLRRLPDIPLWPFDATRVDAAPYAYKRLQTPDGVLMIGTYAVTALLVAAGGRDRAERNPALPLLLATKTGYDSYTNLKLAREEWNDTRALCGSARRPRSPRSCVLRARPAGGLARGPGRPALTT